MKDGGTRYGGVSGVDGADGGDGGGGDNGGSEGTCVKAGWTGMSDGPRGADTDGTLMARLPQTCATVKKRKRKKGDATCCSLAMV